MRIRYAAKTDPGLKRSHNEDFFSLIEDEQLFLVADGMGGHASGEVASKMAADCIREFFDRSKDEDTTWPYKILQIRGTAQVETIQGMVPEYAAAAERYFGAEQGQAWVEQVRTLFSHMARIVVRPEWVGLLDFKTRFPGVIATAMSRA